MGAEEYQVISSTLLQITNYIWDIVVRARMGYANEIDVHRAYIFAGEARAILEYSKRNGDFVPETTAWLTNEVLEALGDAKVTVS